LPREGAMRFAFDVQIPFILKGYYGRWVCPHAEVHYQPLPADIYRGDVPSPLCPEISLADWQLHSGAAAAAVMEEAAVKGDLPFRLFLRRVGIHVRVVVVLGVFDFGVVEGGLYIPYILPRLLH